MATNVMCYWKGN